MAASIADTEQAGAIEPYRDAALYDWEYRRRRHDIAFYRMLAAERLGAHDANKRWRSATILDLGCGSGRLAVPLARDGHRVVGVDLSSPMLAAAAARLHRAPRAAVGRCLLLRGDLRALPLRGHFPLAIAAFHTVQHLIEDRDLVSFFRAVRRLIKPDGWFVFDVFFPNPRWLARPPNREFDRTVVRHPKTGHRLVYTISHQLDRERRALHMALRYQPVDDQGTPSARAEVLRLCHRQLPPQDVESLLGRGGLQIVNRWGGFAGEPFPAASTIPPAAVDDEEPTEQHVYLTRPAAGARNHSSKRRDFQGFSRGLRRETANSERDSLDTPPAPRYDPIGFGLRV